MKKYLVAALLAVTTFAFGAVIGVGYTPDRNQSISVTDERSEICDYFSSMVGMPLKRAVWEQKIPPEKMEGCYVEQNGAYHFLFEDGSVESVYKEVFKKPE